MPVLAAWISCPQVPRFQGQYLRLFLSFFVTCYVLSGGYSPKTISLAVRPGGDGFGVGTWQNGDRVAMKNKFLSLHPVPAFVTPAPSPGQNSPRRLRLASLFNYSHYSFGPRQALHSATWFLSSTLKFVFSSVRAGFSHLQETASNQRILGIHTKDRQTTLSLFPSVAKTHRARFP